MLVTCLIVEHARVKRCAPSLKFAAVCGSTLEPRIGIVETTKVIQSHVTHVHDESQMLAHLTRLDRRIDMGPKCGREYGTDLRLSR